MIIKKTYQINTNRGVDLTSSTLGVSPSRASYMLNMINDGGVNKKRHGWNEIACFKDTDGNELAINGIWEYVHPTTRDKSLIVYAGTQFFKCDYDFTVQEKITVESGANVNGEKCKAYYKDGLLWIIGCGDYLVYDGTSILMVGNSKYAYVPTTTIGITTSGKMERNETLNLLTNKRKNKLIGENSQQNLYTLDGKIDLNEPLNVEIELYLGDSNYYGNYVPLTVRLDSAGILASDIFSATETQIKTLFSEIGSLYKYKNTEDIAVRFEQSLYVETACFYAQAGCAIPHMEFYNGAEIVYSTSEKALVDSPKSTLDLTDELKNQKVTKMVIKAQEGNNYMYLQKIQITAQRECTGLVNAKYEGSISESGSISISRAKTPFGEGTLYNDEGEHTITADISNLNGRGRILFYENVITPLTDSSNITVEYYATDEKMNIDLTASDVYTQPNGVDLLLVANRGNVIFYNGLDSADCEYSFGYIPAEKFITFGTDRDKITAIVPMADCVGVFKGKSFYRVTFTFNADSANYEADYVPQITVSTDSSGCANQFVNCDVNGDTIIFDGKNVYGIDFSAQQKSLRLRSSNINKAFEKYSREQIESAVACEHEGRYYLFISSDVYIADSRFKVYESNRLDTSFEYEWWIWDNCSATVVYSINGNLYMGRENGKVAVFDKEYSDRGLFIVKSKDGEVSAEIDETMKRYSVLTFDNSLDVKDGDKIKIKGAYQIIGFGVTMTKYGDYVKTPHAYLDGGYIGKEIIIASTMEKCKIIDIDMLNGDFIIDAVSCNEKEDIYCEIENKFFTLDAFSGEENKGKFYFYDGVGGACITGYDDFEITVLQSKNVECEYHTPVLDLGTNLCLKTLNQLLITVSNDTEGLFEVGYRTNKNNTSIERKIGSALDFNNFDFNTLSFDGNFYKTHVKRVFERNFNYILFKFASSSNKPFSIENFSCIYTTNNKLIRGDR